MSFLETKKAKSLNRLVESSVFQSENLEFESLALLAGKLKDLPKAKIPEFSMKRRYLLSEHEEAVIKSNFLINFSKIFAGTIAAFMLIFFGAVGYADSQILPGNALFAWKLGVEHTRLVLSGGESGKAELSLHYAEKRLVEAQKVFADPNSSQKAQAEALSVLAKQTQDAVKSVTGLGVTSSTPELLDGLVAITESQVDLLEKSTIEDEKVQNTPALAEARQAVKTAGLAKLMAAATTEGTLAGLGIVSEQVEGTILSIGDGHLVLEGLVLDVGMFEGTKVVFEDSETQTLAAGQKVVVQADFNLKKTSALARTVTVLSEIVVTPKVKSESVVKSIEEADQVETEDVQDSTDTLEEVNRISTGFRVESPTLESSVTD